MGYTQNGLNDLIMSEILLYSSGEVDFYVGTDSSQDLKNPSELQLRIYIKDLYIRLNKIQQEALEKGISNSGVEVSLVAIIGDKPSKNITEYDYKERVNKISNKYDENIKSIDKKYLEELKRISKNQSRAIKRNSRNIERYDIQRNDAFNLYKKELYKNEKNRKAATKRANSRVGNYKKTVLFNIITK